VYVSERSFDFGDERRRAIAELLRRAQAIGTFGRPLKIDFAV